MKEGEALRSVTKQITQEAISEYAVASGDMNPIHVDQDFAARSQFGGTIAHGMMVAASVSEMMSAEFGTDWVESGRLKLRFRAPVYPGSDVTAYGQVKRVGAADGGSEIVCSVGVRNESGEDAVTGEATVKTEAAS
ncbi:MAG: MaoC family dehydratase [SAR202 cluster bacterium]|nr:MaoC family dehydratase [SAR202 cluster bacterium]